MSSSMVIVVASSRCEHPGFISQWSRIFNLKWIALAIILEFEVGIPPSGFHGCLWEKWSYFARHCLHDDVSPCWELRMARIGLGIVCKSEAGGILALFTYLVKETGWNCGDCNVGLCWWTVAAKWWTKMVFCIKIRCRTALCKRCLGVGS